MLEKIEVFVDASINKSENIGQLLESFVKI
jgi:hypothetical protein